MTSKLLKALGLFAVVTSLLLGLAPGRAAAQSASDESGLLAATNQSRADNGLPALQYDPQLSQISNAWADQLASSGTLQHNPNLVDQVNAQVTTQWTRLGENVGYGPSVSALEDAFMNSSAHRANILGQYNRVGIGATRDSRGTLWVVVNFMQGPSIGQSDPPGTVHPMAWYLRNAPAAGPADFAFKYGLPGYQFVSGDWDGNGTDSIGVFFNGNWYLRNSSSAGSADVSFAYGAPGYVPVIGDWDGNGTDTIGVYYNGWFYLRNSNTPGPANIVVNYGAPGYTAAVGDWDGNGTDSIGVYVNGWWYLRNSTTPGPANLVVNYGMNGYQPVVGDWDGNGTDGIGVYVNGWWYLRNSTTPGPANNVVNYGSTGYAPIVGHWGSSAPDGIGVIIPS